MAQISDQTAVAVAGTAVPIGPSNISGNNWYIIAMSGNIGLVYIGNDGAGDVTSLNGFPLEGGVGLKINAVNLADIFVDADNNGDKIAWLRLG